MIEKILEQIDENTLTKESVYFLNEHGIKLVSASKMKEIVQEVAKDGGWIPTEKELPSNGTYVYVTCHSHVDDGTDWVAQSFYFNDTWGIPLVDCGKAEVIAWMEEKLPAPYQKGEEK